MGTIALLIVFGVVIYLAVKYGKGGAGKVALGIVFGLLLASTAAGPPIVAGIQKVGGAVVEVLTKSAA